MMPPWAYDQAVAAAPEVLHLRLLTRTAPDAMGVALLRAEVAAVLRGARSPGAIVELRVATPPDAPRPGPVLYRSVAALDRAGYAEAHLTSGGEIAGHGAGLILLDSLPDGMAWAPGAKTAGPD